MAQFSYFNLLKAPHLNTMATLLLLVIFMIIYYYYYYYYYLFDCNWVLARWQ
jgi:hypothetical protein